MLLSMCYLDMLKTNNCHCNQLCLGIKVMMYAELVFNPCGNYYESYDRMIEFSSVQTIDSVFIVNGPNQSKCIRITQDCRFDPHGEKHYVNFLNSFLINVMTYVMTVQNKF